MQTIRHRSPDGHEIASRCFEPHGPARGQVLIAAAMAVPQSFYAPFAAWLAGRGYRTWTFDYRGIGESRRGSLRSPISSSRWGSTRSSTSSAPRPIRPRTLTRLA